MSGRDDSASQRRAPGTRYLRLLAEPHVAAVVRALFRCSMRIDDLCEETGEEKEALLPALERLRTVGAVDLSGDCYELTSQGRELHGVAGHIQDWLAKSPKGRLELGSEEARVPIEAMADAADSGLLGALLSGDSGSGRRGGPGIG